MTGTFFCKKAISGLPANFKILSLDKRYLELKNILGIDGYILNADHHIFGFFAKN
jgi:hypothetical protein